MEETVELTVLTANGGYTLDIPHFVTPEQAAKICDILDWPF